MLSIKSLNKWANAHTYYWLDILRVALGVFFFIKGVNFISQTETLVELIDPLKGFGGTILVVHYVASAHLVGGYINCVWTAYQMGSYCSDSNSCWCYSN